MNKKIIQELEKLRLQYDETGDVNREKAYQRAIDSINLHNERITSGKDAMRLPGIAEGIGWRIDKVLGTSTVAKKGTHSSAKSITSKLDNEQIIIPRVTFIDTSARGHSAHSVSRAYAEKLLNIIKQKVPSDCHVVLADEYRRGYNNLSRLLFLFTEKSMPKTIRRSERHMKNAIEHLKVKLTNISYRGAGRINATINSIPCVFLAIPASEWPFALLRYTGPLTTYKQMQQIARNSGFNLTERELRNNNSISEICHTEKDIFNKLKLEYISPNMR